MTDVDDEAEAEAETTAARMKILLMASLSTTTMVALVTMEVLTTVVVAHMADSRATVDNRDMAEARAVTVAATND